MCLTERHKITFLNHTEWKFHDFSIIQIFREINFNEFEGPKSVILTHLEALNFDSYEFLHFLKGEIDQINKNQKPKICKKGSFCASRILKIDFT